MSDAQNNNLKGQNFALRHIAKYIDCQMPTYQAVQKHWDKQQETIDRLTAERDVMKDKLEKHEFALIDVIGSLVGIVYALPPESKIKSILDDLRIRTQEKALEARENGGDSDE